MATPIRIKRSAVPGKRPQVADLQLGELALNTHDAELLTLRERVGIGTDVVRLGAGATVTNVLYVTTDGNDNNTGKKLGDAKRTIAAAVGAATSGTVIRVSAGSYVENNPIAIPDQVSIVGDSLREVSITPQNQGDLFYVGAGNYVAEMSFVGSANTGAIFAFNPNNQRYINQSPYIQNCTNFIPNSIGLKVDGKNAIGPLKSMVLDSYTQYNQGGIGVSITNEGYAQLVSLFTICDDIAVYCGTGGACDLTNSNSSFGNYGLIADGVSPQKYIGTVVQESSANSDTFVLDISSPTKVLTNVEYDHTTGFTTITTSQNHNFNVGMSVSVRNAAFICPSSPSPSFSQKTVVGAVYDNVTGIATIQTLGVHGYSVGMGISIRDLEFTCPSGPGIVTYPSGSNGYVFEVLNTPSSNEFTINVGTSTLPHTYSDGGVSNFIGYVFPNGSLGYTFEVRDVLSSTQFVVNTGVSTLAHTYTGGGTVKLNTPRPFDGQVVYFNDLYYSIGKISVGSGGTGYTSTPEITIDPPNTEWGVPATALANVVNGTIESVEIISSGRGYNSPPNITVASPNVGINTATLTLQMLPTYYTIQRSTVPSSGICTVILNENVPFAVGVGTSVPFFKQSRVLASGHSLEYIGSGTNITNAIPLNGGVAKQENETDMRNGGLVVYTSTDQSGNFRIGDGVVINQLNGTISGTFYSKSLFSSVTPFILALGGS